MRIANYYLLLTNRLLKHDSDHLKPSPEFVARILGDSQLPWPEDVSIAKSLHNSTRNYSELLPLKSIAYHNSVLPALWRFLVDRI